MKRGAGTFDIELGRRLRLARRSKGLSQQRVGEYLGVTFQQVQKYERGTNRLSVASLVRLQDLYGVPLPQLIPGNDKAFPLPELDRQAAGLICDLRAIRCEKVRGHLAALVRSLAASQRAEAVRTRSISSPDSTGTP